jgi:hypothetical protein
MKMKAFWDIALCSLVEFISLMMEAVRTSETSVYSNETTRRYVPEGSHLNIKFIFTVLCFELTLMACILKP